MERSLTRDEERIEVLDKMVMRLYEDMIAGRISEQNFNTMLEKTQTEQAELKAKVSEGRKRLSDEVQLANDAKQWWKPFRNTPISQSWTQPPSTA